MLNEFIGWLFVHPPLLPLFGCMMILLGGFIGGVIGHKAYDYLLK